MPLKKIGRPLILALALTTLLIGPGSVLYYYAQFEKGIARADKEWAEDQPNKVSNFGSTRTLSILPLVNWKTRDDRFKGEAGVSYLIKTDHQILLFDVGLNAKNESPSPLQYNMSQLGIKIEDIDTLFFSHHHLDHSGGQQWVNKNTFSLGTSQIDLSDKKIFVPVPIQYPNAEVTITQQAATIGPGLASTGAISRQLFMGRIEEQALAINVQDKGLVLIVGCGHQTLPKILQRTERVFDEPIYGLVGDLHYPVPQGRLELLGINLQRIFASGEGPLYPIEQATIDHEIELLKSIQPSVVALGTHDTSDQVIADFRQTFGSRYHDVLVGEWITISE